MKKLFIALLLFALTLSARPGDPELAPRLISEGWCYVAPRPKSPQATWGNYDKRTTWWEGYWINTKIGECSGATPRYLSTHNIVVGDGLECRELEISYRRGGYVPVSGLQERCLCKTEK